MILVQSIFYLALAALTMAMFRIATGVAKSKQLSTNN